MYIVNGGTASKSVLDRAHECLSNPRRRVVLYHLLERDRVTVEECARAIVASEQDGTVDDSGSPLEQVELALVHNHLPRLRDYDILEYDVRSGDVIKRQGFETIEPIVETSRRLELGVDDPVETSLPAVDHFPE